MTPLVLVGRASCAGRRSTYQNEWRGAAVASHDFDDVPNSHPFHSDISWLVANGITQGYDDGTYRPSEPVSRGSMVAFLRRLAQGEAVEPRVWHGTRATPIAIGGTEINPTNVVVVGSATTNPLPVGTYLVTVSGVMGASADRVIACNLVGGGLAGSLQVLSMPPTVASQWATSNVTPVSFSGTAVVKLTSPASITWRCWKSFGLTTPYPTVKGNVVVEAVRDL